MRFGKRHAGQAALLAGVFSLCAAAAHQVVRSHLLSTSRGPSATQMKMELLLIEQQLHVTNPEEALELLKISPPHHWSAEKTAETMTKLRLYPQQIDALQREKQWNSRHL